MTTAKAPAAAHANSTMSAAQQAKEMAKTVKDRIDHSTKIERLAAGATLAAGVAVAAYAVSKTNGRPASRVNRKPIKSN